MDRDIITAEEAAELYPFTRRVLWERQRNGSLPGFKVGRRTYFRRSELEALLATTKPEPVAETVVTPSHKPRISRRFFLGG